MSGSLSAIVLAAGGGTRMRSTLPKPLHRLCGRPMVLHVLDALAELDVDRVVVVVGHGGDWVTKTGHRAGPGRPRGRVRRAAGQRGTGDAASVGLTALPRRTTTTRRTSWSSPGRHAAAPPTTLAALVRAHRSREAGATLLTAEVAGPDRLRPDRAASKDGQVAGVVEEADATARSRPRSPR